MMWRWIGAHKIEIERWTHMLKRIGLKKTKIIQGSKSKLCEIWLITSLELDNVS